MKKILTTLSAFFLFSTCSFFVHAQDAYSEDFGIWGTVSLEKKLSEKLYVKLEEELRTFDNASRIDQFFTNVGVQYRLNKNIRFALVYRFINKSRDDMSYSKRHRLYVDASYRRKVYNFTFIYRLRTQSQVQDYLSSDDGKYPETFMRHKIDVKYQVKKFIPYVAAEFFLQLNDPRFHEADNQWTRERFYFGLEYELNKRETLGSFFMIQRDMNVNNLQREYVLGFEYAYSF
jgi:hypothetical protein